MSDRGKAREVWEHAEPGGVHRWHWPQVVAVTVAAALVWSALMYVLTLVLGLVV